MDKEKIILEIRKIIYEINNPRNDGWVKKHYEDILKKIKDIIDSSEET